MCAIDEETVEYEALECPMCGAPNYPAGDLGSRTHYSCRGCGMWYSSRA